MAKAYSSEFQIQNRLGLHARPASLFVQTAAKFDSDITVRRLDSPSLDPVNGKSLMNMLILSAACGTRIEIAARGADAEDAVKTLGELVDRRFDEE